MTTNPYVVAGIDMRPFVQDWLAELNNGGGIMRRLLDRVYEEDQSDLLRYGPSFLMANIAPRATTEDASSEELLLSAALLLYQMDGYPGAGPAQAFDGFQAHVDRAFHHLADIGPKAAAHKLRHRIIEQAGPGPDAYQNMMKRFAAEDPAKHAEQQRELAHLAQRELRAADLLDPDGDFDLMLLRDGPGE